MSPYSLIRCRELWMHSILECQLLVDKMLKIKIRTMINLYRKKGDSLELQTDTKIMIQMRY
jgi:hypothetical protein